MKFWKAYIASKKNMVLGFLFFSCIYLGTFALYQLPIKAMIYPTVLCMTFGLICCVWDYFYKKEKYDALCFMEKNLDEITVNLPKAQDEIEKQYQDILLLMQEEQGRRINLANAKYQDMMEYYTMWVHQIKTPISSIRLLLSEEDTDHARRMTADLNRIEQYVAMVLTYLRLESQSNDLVLREYELDEIIKPCIRKFAPEFIGRKLSLNYEPIHARIVTDEKWFAFCLEQILSNSLKYTNHGTITIEMNDECLVIADTGIGIDPSDIPRIFEKGYTGFNGRRETRASGIGLYLCKRICDMLGIAIRAESEIEKGTRMILQLNQQEINFKE